ncbi:hypothetical protein [Hydrogenimonas sp. SS33]|uniref:YceD family protein n=1 Tax=Hydrogenimonas leucolamina TaxID=2954236 RepID=UPI00336BDB51
MKILLRKIHETRQPFTIEQGEAVCRGEFWRSGKHEVTVEGSVEGSIELDCDRCGESFRQSLQEPFSVEVVDRPLKVDESLDVIECPDGYVDFDMICESEIASIRSEYHLCPRCAKDENFEIEI